MKHIEDCCCTQCEAAAGLYTAPTPKRVKRVEVGSTEWLGRMAKRVERHADEIDPDKDPSRRTSRERADDLRAIAKAMRERSNAA